MKRKTLEIVKTLLLIAALAFFVIIATFQLYEMNEVKMESERIVLGVNSSTSDNFGQALKGQPVPIGKYMGLVSGGRFTVIDKNAREKNDEENLLSDPVLHAKGEFCIVADYGGTVAKLYENEKIETVVETEKKIISVATNSHGFFAIATEGVGYDAVITVYRKNGEAIYRYNIAKNDFVDMEISENNRRLIIVESNLSTGVVASNVVVAEFNRADAQNVFTEVSNLYVKVHCNKDGSFVCIGSERSDFYRADGKKYAKIEYGGKTLTGAEFNSDDILYLSFDGINENETGVSVVEIYDKKANLKGTCNFTDSVEYICANGAYCSVATGDEATIIKSNGKIKKTFSMTAPVKCAAAFADGETAVIFSGGNTTIVK
ncbi:MAG: DUF5711 family protein [Clostridia bacterium]